jgi:hypothetical protein
MRTFATVALLMLFACAAGLAQMSLVAEHNAYTTKNTWTGPDSLRPYATDQGVRRVFVATADLDKDGKQELLATDYSRGGRVHVFEYNNGKLELVWSSPKMYSTNGFSTPRWIQVGDLDGDGNKEIIFPAGDRYAGAVYVYEYNGSNNGYGQSGMADLTLPATFFTPTLGAGSAFRMDRESGCVYDFDNDGRDELILANQDGKVYVLGVVGDIGGFGSWAIEGGDPAVTPDNKFSGGSWWHSFPADIDGDGKKEIVNHYWNYWGFWSIDPVATDTYRYPKPSVDSLTNPKAKTQFYHEYLRDHGTDACSYMGIHPADVDGDGKQELPGVVYSGASDIEFFVTLTSLSKSDTGVYVWKDSTQFGLIGKELWKLAGKTAGSHWGFDSYDFDKDGKDEIYVGGSADYNVIQMKYKGTGAVLDANNYTNTIVYPGDKARYHELTYHDSLGIKRDTAYAESPFLSGIYAGGDIDGDGKKELAIAYQSIADSITYKWWHWDTTGIVPTWVSDSTKKGLNTNVIDIRVLEYGGASGFREETYAVVTPDDYVLNQNYPNPFNPSTEIKFSLPVDKNISLTVFDMLGKEVKTLIANQDYTSGSHSMTWDGTNNAGHSVASGTYVYTLKFGNFQKSQKMMLLR